MLHRPPQSAASSCRELHSLLPHLLRWNATRPAGLLMDCIPVLQGPRSQQGLGVGTPQLRRRGLGPVRQLPQSLHSCQRRSACEHAMGIRCCMLQPVGPVRTRAGFLERPGCDSICTAASAAAPASMQPA